MIPIFEQIRAQALQKEGILPVILSKLFGGHMFNIPESPIEIWNGIESALYAYLCYCHGCFDKQMCSIANSYLIYVTRYGTVCFLLEETAQGIRSHIDQCRQSIHADFFRVMIVYEIFDAFDADCCGDVYDNLA